MIIPGIVSVTFRKLSAAEIIELAKNNNLKAVEWGADVHCKLGDIESIKNVNKLSEENGISPISYGSYYWAGFEEEKTNFNDVIASCKTLGAKNIRAWAGKKGSLDATKEDVKRTVEELNRCCELAAKENITVSCEYHPNTLTDTRESAVALAKAVAAPNFRLYWQPTFVLSDKENLKSFEAVFPWVSNVHVFSWEGLGSARYPLANSFDMFKECANMLKTDSKDHGMFLEFVKGDSIESFIEDAKTLNEIIL